MLDILALRWPVDWSTPSTLERVMSNVWKYEAIADALRADIAHGRLGPGDRVPSSRTLATQRNISRATAQEALAVLVDDGLIYNRTGVGYFVTDTAVARPAGSRSVASSRIEGALPFRILGTPAFTPPPDRIRGRLGLAAGERALARTRLLTTADGEPVSLVTAWFPPDIAAACELLAGTDPLPGGTTRYVYERTGLRPANGEDTTTPRLATAEEAEILGLELPAAVQVVLHQATDPTGKVLVVEEGVTGASFAERVDEYPMSV
jgi:GntR family transcriptional regulator